MPKHDLTRALLFLAIFLLSACTDSFEQSSPLSTERGRTLTLSASEDRDDWTANSGSAKWLNTSLYTTTYLKFSLASVTGDVSSASLRLYRGKLPQNNVTLNLYKVEQDTWNEASAASLPQIGALLGSQQNAPGTYVEVDITDYVKAEQTGDKVISFAVRADHRNWVILGSREGEQPPQLLINTSDTPVPDPTPNPDPTPDPPPPPPNPTQPPASKTIPLSQFDALVNPNNWQGSNRSKGNLVVAGSLFTPGQTAGRFGDQLTMRSDGSIHSFAMKDGKTLRWGVVDNVGIQGKAIESATQWIDNSSYEYQAGINNSTVKYPNDQLFFDGTRNQLGFGEVPIRSGKGANRFLFGTLVKYGDWANKASENKASLFSIHSPDEPGVPGPGLLTGYINERGQLVIVGRVNSGGGSSWETVLEKTIPVERLDSWLGFVFEGKLSPNASDNPYLKVWVKEESGQWSLAIDHKGPIGYSYNDATLNNKNYPIMANYYSWHHWGNTFDTRYPVRRLWYGFAGLVKGSQYSAEEMMATVSSFW